MAQQQNNDPSAPPAAQPPAGDPLAGVPPATYGAPYAQPYPPYGQTAAYGAQPVYGQPVYGQPYAQATPPVFGAAQGVVHGYGGGDVETGDGKMGDDAPTGFGPDDIPADKLLSNDLPIEVRHGFIRKVYALFGAELLVTFGIAAIFVFSPSAATWLLNNQWLYWTSLCLSIVLIITLACCTGVARSFPINLILTFLFAACFGVLIGALGAVYETSTFMIAVGCTAGVVIAVTIFACQTKIDFTGCGGYLFVGLVVLMIMGLVGAIFMRGSETYHVVYASIGVLLFSFYLVFDTQLILGGKKNELSIDDYVMASIMLYTDTINIFIYLMTIVGAANE